MGNRTTPPVDRRTVEPTATNIEGLVDAPTDQPVVMLNLLRFRDVADYTDDPDLAPDEPISGAEAYRRYGEAAGPFVAQVGGRPIYAGPCHASVIAPEGEHWDLMLLVRYEDLSGFAALGANPGYQKVAGHRTAALLDSRLILSTPMTD